MVGEEGVVVLQCLLVVHLLGLAGLGGPEGVDAIASVLGGKRHFRGGFG